MNIYICYIGIVQIDIRLPTPSPILVICPNHNIITSFKLTTLNTSKRYANQEFWLLALLIEWSSQDKLRQQKSAYLDDVGEDVTKGKWICGCFVQIQTITEAENGTVWTV
jgi:hypothetical protein